MITKDVYGRYDEFFRSINKLLGYEKGSSDEILDINGYFTAIEEIKQKVLDPINTEADPYFLILPNDEPLLKIDANTRKIDTKGWEAGIGTQGDELAEIIYFSIDRYFDVADLYDKEIFVQWENAVGDQGLSVTINKTVNYPDAPNKLVFGWPITSDITKAAGNVKFSVRFYTRNNPDKGEKYELYYSLGTITATLKVNPSLDMDIENPEATNYKVVDKNWIIYNMMRNSTVPGLDVTAVAPTFETPIPAFNTPFNLGDAELPFKIRAKFSSEDDKSGMGTISYSWTRLSKDEKVETPLSEADGVKNTYESNADTTRNEYDHYYTKNAKGEYITYTGSIPPEDDIEVYKLFTTLTPDQAGYYYVTATNKAGRGNQKDSKSGKWLIAFAADPKIEYPGSIKHTIILNAEGATLAPQISASDNGVLSYQWCRYDDSKKEYLELTGKTEATLTGITVEGKYSVKVTNNKNNSEATVTSEDMRVTVPASELPEQITFRTEAGTAASGGTIAEVPRDSIISVEYSALEKSDKVAYQWYDNSNSLIEGADTDKCKITKGGQYKVKITNSYNENTTDKEYTIFIALAE